MTNDEIRMSNQTASPNDEGGGAETQVLRNGNVAEGVTRCFMPIHIRRRDKSPLDANLRYGYGYGKTDAYAASVLYGTGSSDRGVRRMHLNNVR
jgi:hypothetical protein